MICEEDDAAAVLNSDGKRVKAAATIANRRQNARTNKGRFLVTVNTNAVQGSLAACGGRSTQRPLRLSAEKGRGVCGEDTVE